MSPQGRDILLRTYYAAVGSHPPADMEDWEIVRALMHHRYHKQSAGTVDRELWVLCMRTVFEEVDLDPFTAEQVEEELTILNASASGSAAGTELM